MSTPPDPDGQGPRLPPVLSNDPSIAAVASIPPDPTLTEDHPAEDEKPAS